MSNIDLVHMIGDAMAVPLRAVTLLHESVGAFDEIAEDAAGDASSLALAATERAATIVLNALDDLDQKPLECGFVPPFFG